MSGLAERLATLSPARRRLLEEQLRQRGRSLGAAGEIPRRRDRERFPLSFAQQRLWFLDRFTGGGSGYNVPLGYRIDGPLSPRALARALEEVVRRHEVLRTSFRLEGESPVQRPRPPAPVALPLVDLSGLAPAAREAEERRIARQSSGARFDLPAGRVLDVVLVRLADREHRLRLTIHHIVFDGWSTAVLHRELEVLYGALAAGRAPRLDPLPVQYGDFAAWQREVLSGERLEAQATFWRHRLDGVPSLDLPTDRPRPPMQSLVGRARRLAFPAALRERIEAFARRESATPYMVLLAAWAAVLGRHAGQSDFAVASPVAGRTRPEIEGLIGFFVNTLVLRLDLAPEVGGTPSFRALVARVREVAVAAQSHQELPFEKLVEEIQPERDPSRNPLAQVLFALQQEGVIGAPRLPGLTVRHLEFDVVETSRFDLELHLWPGAGGLRGLLIYGADLFDDATAARLARHLATLLEAAAEDPGLLLSRLPILTPGERQGILVEWNAVAPARIPAALLHGLFEAQARRTPEATALIAGSAELTYRELEARAEALARHLRALGVGPEVRVGIALERSPDLVVGILGVLKAGGAYVPIDPEYPRDRLELILEDARARVLLASEGTAGWAPAAAAVLGPETWLRKAAPPVPALPVPAAAENAAYVIYTSGSTGRPKGVVLEHRSAAALVRWAREAFTPEELRGVLFSTSICFDLSIFELFVPLAVGGTVILADDALELPRLPRAGEVTLVNTVPSAMAALARGEGLPPSVRVVNLAGEPLKRDLVNGVYAQPGVRRVLNLYGPSEDTTYSTVAVLDPEGSEAPPIGRPVAGTRVYLLDPELRPVPAGVPGDLHLAGAGLARGYLDRPGLTAARFVPDPWPPAPGGRMYQTGDLARYRPDGTVDFLGRIDHQVKIRGFRIEPGEVEATLARIPGVREAVVTAPEDASGSRRLVAYVVAEDGRARTVEELRSWLLERLPEHMVPSLFLFLDELPLLPNGKVDRRALPSPSGARPELGAAYVSPRDTVELTLAQLWEEVLEVRPVGVYDNFFQLGGHSLLAVALLARVHALYGRDLPVSVLFQRPTVAALAALLQGEEEAEPAPVLVPIQPHGSKPPLFVVHPAGGNVLCYVGLAARLGPDVPLFGFQARALEEEEVVYRSVRDLAADYLNVMRAVQPRGPYWLGGYCLGGTLAFEMARQLTEAGEEVAFLGLVDSFAPVALEEEDFDDAQALSWFARDLGLAVGRRPRIPPEALRGLDPEAAFARVLDCAREAQVLPETAGAAQLRRYFNAYLAASVALLTYRPGRYPGRVSMFAAREAEDKQNLGPTRGWSELAGGGLEVHELPGDHATVIFEPNVGLLAERLQAELERSWAAAGELPRVEAVAPVHRPEVRREPVPAAAASETIRLEHRYVARAPAEAAFGFLSDPRRELEWNDWLLEVRLAPEAVPGEGTIFGTVHRSMGRTFEMTLEIERYQPPRAVTFRVLDGPFSARTAYTLTARDDGATEVRIGFEVDPRSFFGLIPRPLLPPIFRKSLEDDSRRQKALIEAGRPEVAAGGAGRGAGMVAGAWGGS